MIVMATTSGLNFALKMIDIFHESQSVIIQNITKISISISHHFLGPLKLNFELQNFTVKV